VLVATVSDYYQLDDLLSPEDVALRKCVRDVMETHIAPVMAKVSLLSRNSCSSLDATLRWGNSHEVIIGGNMKLIVSRHLRWPLERLHFSFLRGFRHLSQSLMIPVTDIMHGADA
jgi:hypothetical protein